MSNNRYPQKTTNNQGKKPQLLHILIPALIGILILVLVAYLLLREKGSTTDETQVTFTNSENEKITITVEIADSPTEIQNGLMHRESLPEDHGMLFKFEDEQYRTFWMKDTLIPLDMIFIDANGTIVNIAENTKPNQTEERYNSQEKAKYVIEVNGGWCKRNRVEKGDKATIP